MFQLGIDLGQRRDHTAIAIVERRQTSTTGFDYVNWRPTTAADPETWFVHRLERIPLGTPYTAVADRLTALDKHPNLHGQTTFIVDATGVGAPVVDMLRTRGLGSRLIPVILTGAQSSRFDGYSWNVSKVDLLARLQMLFDTKRLQISRRALYAQQLIRELAGIRARPAARDASTSAPTPTPNTTTSSSPSPSPRGRPPAAEPKVTTASAGCNGDCSDMSDRPPKAFRRYHAIRRKGNRRLRRCPQLPSWVIVIHAQQDM